MIDLGITKLALIGVVALVVIGPEKLPKVARMAGTLLGRAQRYINDVKSEVSREIELEEFRRMQKDVQDAALNVEQSVSKAVSEAEDEFRSIGKTSFADASPLLDPPTTDSLSVKAKDFRRKKLSRTSAVPLWYKNRHGQRSHVISGSARMARHRPGSSRGTSHNSFF
ncbi:Sec-independent protein translocase protein TatB [Undibacterium sp. SXout7W]|uniref:Sec-independent protein translocase protein TatB n=1 Tax=Undibacterium sp. SXout7W TaxID=3413049 RepID=UPI003BF20150